MADRLRYAVPLVGTYVTGSAPRTVAPPRERQKRFYRCECGLWWGKNKHFRCYCGRLPPSKESSR